MDTLWEMGCGSWISIDCEIVCCTAKQHLAKRPLDRRAQLTTRHESRVLARCRANLLVRASKLRYRST